MHLEKMNPTTPARAFIGFGVSQSYAACDLEHITISLALKQIRERVAVSEPVALIMAQHAGLIREAR
ncbi:MAG: hypothetical protein DCF30_15850 [Hyphomicrobiales bacterium]|nr:MAG: hypothetical protein DCF30_15850 [Hyphomicrobiales bacterium]